LGGGWRNRSISAGRRNERGVPAAAATRNAVSVPVERWSNAGQTLVKRWSNAGQTLVKRWSNAGQPVAHGRPVGPAVGPPFDHWSNAGVAGGQTPARQGEDFQFVRCVGMNAEMQLISEMQLMSEMLLMSE
jgi:hypothetical protein